jgi:hypothetical protein
MATDCATKLAEAEAALHKLMTGTQSVEVWDGDYRVRYSATNISSLEAYIARLKAECGGAGGAADDSNVRKPFRVRF